MTLELDILTASHLIQVLEDDNERAAAHIAWLGEHPEEPDADVQGAQSSQRIELNNEVLRLIGRPNGDTLG